MVVLKGWKISIVADGQNLREYDEPDDDSDEAGNSSPADKVTKYIEAVSGSHFKIKYGIISKLPSKDNAFEVDFLVDGALADSRVIEPKTHLSDHWFSEGILKCAHGSWSLQRFRFAAIIHDETQNAKTSHTEISRVAKLGTIEVKIYGTKIESRGNQVLTWNGNAKLSESRSIPEKALKGCAKSHQTSVDLPEPMAARTTIRSSRLNPERPYATFIFKYRSHRALQTEGVIPRSPSPLPLEDRSEESLTREELLELLRRRAKPTKPEVKPDHSAGTSVKRERDPEVDEILSSARAHKVGRRAAEIEVIDLLDD